MARRPNRRRVIQKGAAVRYGGATQLQQPKSVTAPSLTGSVGVGQVLTINRGVYTGSPSPVTIVVLRNGVPIESTRNATSYTQVTADIGAKLSVLERVSNVKGYTVARGPESPAVPNSGSIIIPPVDGGTTPPLPTPGPSTASFVIGSTAAFVSLTNLAGRKAVGYTPNDGRLAIATNGTALAPGLTASSPGKTTYTVALDDGTSFPMDITASAAAGTVTGIVANRGAIASRNTLTPASGAVTAQTLNQFTLTAPARYLRLTYQNILTNNAQLITTGIPDLTLRVGIRLRVQTGVTTEFVVPTWAEDVSSGASGANRDITMVSGAYGDLYADLGKVYDKGTSLLFQTWPRFASTPSRYPETDTFSLAFNEVNAYGASLPDISLGISQWSSVTKAGSYGPFIPRFIQGLKLDSKPRAFLLGGDSISSAGSGDGNPSQAVGQGFVGWVQRALRANFGWSNVGVTGLSLGSVRSTPNSLAARITQMLDKGFTDFICAWGPNDIASQASPAQHLANLDWLDGVCRAAGVNLIPCTIPPRPNTSNASNSVNGLDTAYASTVGMSVSAALAQINAAIRTDKPGAPAGSGRYGNGFLDPAASVADPNDPTIFRTDTGFTFSGDGIHFPTAYHIQAAADAEAKLLATTVAPVVLSNTALPQVAGDMMPGQLLFLSSAGTWKNGSTTITPDEVQVQWQRRSTATPGATVEDISGSTGMSFTQRQSDHAYFMYANVRVRLGSVWSDWVRTRGSKCSLVAFGTWLGGGGRRVGRNFEDITGRTMRWVKDGLTNTSFSQFASSAPDSMGLWIDEGQLGRTPSLDRTFVLNVPMACEWTGIDANGRNPATAAPAPRFTAADANVSIGYGLRYTYQNFNTQTGTVSAIDATANTVSIPQALYDTTNDGDRFLFSSTGTNITCAGMNTVNGVPQPLPATTYHYAKKNGGNSILLYASPNSAKAGLSNGLRDITDVGTGTFTASRARFEDANGVGLAISDISNPSPFVLNYINQAVTSIFANTIYGRAATLSDGSRDYANSPGYRVIKGRFGHEMNGVWYLWDAFPGYEAEHKFCARFMINAFWNKFAELILANHSAKLIADYGAANATTALIAAKALMRPVFCANKNAPSGALMQDFWWGDDIMAGGLKPDGTVAYPPGDVTLDLYNDRWGTKFGSDENQPMTGTNLANYLKDREWRESPARADKIEYFVAYMLGESIPESVANSYANKNKNGFCLKWLDDFTANQVGRPGGMAPGRTIADLEFPMGLSEYGGGARLYSAIPRGGSGDDEVYYELIHRWMDGTLHIWLAAEIGLTLNHWGVGRRATAECGAWIVAGADYKTGAFQSTVFENALRNALFTRWGTDTGNFQIDTDPGRHVVGRFMETAPLSRIYSDTDLLKNGVVIATAGPFTTEGEFPHRLLEEQPLSALQWATDWLPEGMRARMRSPTPLAKPNITIPTTFSVAKGRRNQLPYLMPNGYNRLIEFLVNTTAPASSPATGAVVADTDSNNVFSVSEVDASRTSTGTTDYHSLVNKRHLLEAGATQFNPYVGANQFEAALTVATAADVGEKISVVISDPINATINGGTAAVTCTATIVDGFTLADVSIPENGRFATITVTRAAHNSLASKVRWEAMKVPRTSGLALTGSALAVPGVDFTAASGEISFSATEVSKTFQVPITEGGATAIPKEFWVKLSIPTGEQGALLRSYGRVTMTPAVAMTMVSSPSAVSVNESAGTVTIPVTLDAAATSQVTVDYATSDGTAVSPGDYAAASGTLTFAAGETTKNVTISIVSSNTSEPTEAFTLTLSNPTIASGLVQLGNSSTTVTIVDDVKSGSNSWLTGMTGLFDATNNADFAAVTGLQPSWRNQKNAADNFGLPRDQGGAVVSGNQPTRTANLTGTGKYALQFMPTQPATDRQSSSGVDMMVGDKDGAISTLFDGLDPSIFMLVAFKPYEKAQATFIAGASRAIDASTTTTTGGTQRIGFARTTAGLVQFVMRFDGRATAGVVTLSTGVTVADNQAAVFAVLHRNGVTSVWASLGGAAATKVIDNVAQSMSASAQAFADLQPSIGAYNLLAGTSPNFYQVANNGAAFSGELRMVGYGNGENFVSTDVIQMIADVNAYLGA